MKQTQMMNFSSNDQRNNCRAKHTKQTLSSNLKMLFAAATLLITFGAAQSIQVKAQASLEFFSPSMSPILNGPTAAPQTARVRLNTDNPGGNTNFAASKLITVTASVSNQQFTGRDTVAPGTPAGNPVVFFGATLNSNGINVLPLPTFVPMSNVSTPASGYYSNTPAGTATGIDVAANYGFSVFTSVRHFIGNEANFPTSGRHRMADLTLTFSSPVNNPYVHITGIGGFNDTDTGTPGQLGFSSELNLITPGLTLTLLRSNTKLAVTPTQINNANATGMNSSCANNEAGCGTVRVNGTNITAIIFRVFLRGDGGESVWSESTDHDGDRWNIGVSLSEAPLGTTSAETNVAGRAKDAATGAGIAGATVNMVNGQSGEVRTAQTDEMGNYSFKEIDAGSFVIISISKADYSFATPQLSMTLTESLDDLDFVGTRIVLLPRKIRRSGRILF